MTRPIRWLPALLVLLLGLAACSGVPSSGPVEIVAKVSNQPNPNNVAAPTPGQPPDGIVREFLGASGQRAGDGATLAAASQYLTPAAQKTWPVTRYSVVILANDQERWDPAKPTEVAVKGTVFGTLDAGGSFREGGGIQYTNTLHVTQVNGQWRITDPPDQVIILQRDFQSNFVQRQLYFLDSTGTVVVPDPRWLNTSTDSLPGKLIDLLIGGPDGVLAGVAGNRLDGAELHSSVLLDPKVGATVVDISKITLQSVASRRALAAQIVYTLTRSRAADQVQIKVGGDLLDADTPIYSLSTLQSFDPDRIPAVGQVASDPYYIDGRGRIAGLTNVGQLMWGQFGDGSLYFDSAAMSAATGAVAAVASDVNGMQLVIGQPAQRVEPLVVLRGDSLSQPSFSRSGDEVWVVQTAQNKPTIYEISASTTPDETPSRISVQLNLGQIKGAVQVLQVSPDGVRVALVIGGQLYLGAVQYADRDDLTGTTGTTAGSPGDTTTTTAPSTTANPTVTKQTAMIKNLRLVGDGLSDVAAVTFSNSTELMVAARTSSTSLATINRVFVDGSLQLAVTSTDQTSDVTAIAIHPDGPESGMYVEFGGRVFELAGNISDGHWVTPPVTTSPVLYGQDPFYPE